LTLVAASGNETASSVLRVTVTRSNSAPEASMSFLDTVAHYTNVCPSPVLCTVTGTARLILGACDADGDGLRFEAEVVASDQAFSGTPTFSSFVSAADPGRTANYKKSGTCASVEYALSSLTVEQSYHFALRVIDDFGATASFP